MPDTPQTPAEVLAENERIAAERRARKAARQVKPQDKPKQGNA